MKANICFPICALMFKLGSAVAKTFAKMINMTVAITVATIVVRAAKNETISIGKERNRKNVQRRWGGLPGCVNPSPLDEGAQPLMDWGGRVEVPNGPTKIKIKLSTVPVTNRPNIH